MTMTSSDHQARLNRLRRYLLDRINTNRVIIHEGGDNATHSLQTINDTLQSIIAVIDEYPTYKSFEDWLNEAAEPILLLGDITHACEEAFKAARL
jgi:hypothetical protein